MLLPSLYYNLEQKDSKRNCPPCFHLSLVRIRARLWSPASTGACSARVRRRSVRPGLAGVFPCDNQLALRQALKPRQHRRTNFASHSQAAVLRPGRRICRHHRLHGSPHISKRSALRTIRLRSAGTKAPLPADEHSGIAWQTCIGRTA